MKRTTKWLPNTTFTTYFGIILMNFWFYYIIFKGKPAFEAYGNNNIKPSVGGYLYGNYMMSHNVNAHRGDNKPDTYQSYKNAILYS